MWKLWKISLYDKKENISESEKIKIINYGKLFGYDSIEYKNYCIENNIKVWKCLYTESKSAENIAWRQLKISDSNTPMKETTLYENLMWNIGIQWFNIDGDIYDMSIQSVSYEDSINGLLYGYESDMWKHIKPNKHIQKLDKPVSVYVLHRDIIKTNLRKHSKWKYPKFIQSENLEENQLTPLDIVNAIMLLENKIIAESISIYHKAKKQYKKNNSNRNKKICDRIKKDFMMYV